jgi:hypothetical protein
MTVVSVREDERRRRRLKVAAGVPRRWIHRVTASVLHPRDGFRPPANSEKGDETMRTKLRLCTATLAILAVGLMAFGTTAASAGGKMA